ncbi:hypothetical protein D3C84_1058830 [compost metagenome]
MVVEPILLPAGALGFVHGDVGRAHQAIEVGAAIGERGNADAGAEGDIQTVDLLADRHPFDEFFGNLRRLLGKLQVQ